MKRFIIAAGLMVSATANAGQLELCNATSAASQNQSYYQPFNAYRGQIALTGTGDAPSITMPALRTGMKNLRIDFQNRNDFIFCLDSSSNNWCGVNPPTGTISNTAWVFKQSSVRLLAISSTMPNTLYVSGTGVTGYSICGEQ